MALTNPAQDAYPGTVVILHTDYDHLETPTHPKGNAYDMINGVLYTFPAGEPVEVPAFTADRVLEHLHYHGFVTVNKVKTPTGIQYDVQEAIDRSKILLEQKDRAAVEQYVLDQLEDRINQGKPALPPGRRLARIIRSRGISLVRQYNLRPINWEEPGEPRQVMGDPTSNISPVDAQKLADLQEENKELRRQQQATDEKLNTVLERLLALTQPRPPAEVGVLAGEGNAVVSAVAEADPSAALKKADKKRTIS